MDDNVLLGQWRTIVPIPRGVWRRHVRGDADLRFMSQDHHRVRNWVVVEIPRAGRPLPPDEISRSLSLPLDRVAGILEDLESHMKFVFRNPDGAVEWAYPVTASQTPHLLTFSTGETVHAA